MLAQFQIGCDMYSTTFHQSNLFITIIQTFWYIMPERYAVVILATKDRKIQLTLESE